LAAVDETGEARHISGDLAKGDPADERRQVNRDLTPTGAIAVACG